MSTQPILQFEDIAFGYRPENGKVLDKLNLSIEPGTVTAILGPNGVGKTTLLHLALGWRHPQQGRILIDGKPLENYPRRELGRWIGLVPQSEHTGFEYSLIEYVLLGRAPYLKPLAMPGPEDVAIAEEALDQVGLSHLKHRPITALSGGEKQLVLVARALTQQPYLMLLDEATSHLDLSNKSRLLEVLRGLRPQGVTVLMTTHEPDVASAIADNLVLMRDGQVTHAGPLTEVMNEEWLSETYQVPIKVREVEGRLTVIWA
jgi:iron complex transport system ATP-binding protein